MTPRPNRIKEIRESRGLTAFQIAERIGVRDVTVYRYESGDTIPSLPVAQKLADALDCTLDELFPAPAKASA